MYSTVFHRNTCIKGKSLLNSLKLNCSSLKFGGNGGCVFNLQFHSFSPSVVVQNIRPITIRMFDKFVSRSGSLRNVLKRYQQTNTMNLNTNVQNNVILYKYEIGIPILIISITLTLSMVTCAIGSYYMYTPKFFTIGKDVKTIKDYRDYGLRIAVFCFLILQIPLSSGLIYFLSARSVKHLILHKGGKQVTVTTFHMLKSQRTIICPVDNISTRIKRGEKSYIPVKIKNIPMYYLLDSAGKFINEELYDHTVGTRKNWMN